jgi:hypothetical protein
VLAAAGLVGAGLALAAPAARGHPNGLSYLDLRPDGATVAAELEIAAAEVAHAVRLDANADGILDEGDVAAVRGALDAWLLASLRLSADGVVCDATPAGVQLRMNSVLRLGLRFRCARPPEQLLVRSLLPDLLGAGHVTAVVVHGPVERRAVLPGDAPTAVLDLRTPARAAFAAFVARLPAGARAALAGPGLWLLLALMFFLLPPGRRLAGALAFLGLAAALAVGLAGRWAPPVRAAGVSACVALALACLGAFRAAPPGRASSAGLCAVAGLVAGLALAADHASTALLADPPLAAAAGFALAWALVLAAAAGAARWLVAAAARRGLRGASGARIAAGLGLALAVVQLLRTLAG